MYNHKEIEKKWQTYWDTNKTFKTTNPIINFDLQKEIIKPKFYVLDMFPYPSGAGLHVGHPEGYTANDIVARYKHAKGFNVLHPMGWDAFGLPAENYAIKTGTHPKTTTENNIAVFKEQIKALGFSYDWDREIDTTDPKYYKWTQWIFSKMFEEGLAYEQDLPINYCPSCKTGLANEEVLGNGTCERCGTIVEKKKIRQWVLAITKYADRLAKDVEELDWPEGIKDMQRQWIGRSEGCQFDLRKKVNGKPFALVLHGWEQNGDINRHWNLWLKEKLEQAGYEVAYPTLPGVDNPNLEKQLGFIEIYKDKIDENSIIIGHSMGAFLAMHFVENLGKKINKLVCVGPIYNGLINEVDWHSGEATASMEKVYSVEKIKENTNDWYAILGENDEYIPYDSAKKYFDEIGVKHFDFKNGGHFTQKYGYTQFPELFDILVPKISVYTTRVDTVFGMTYAVIAPDHKDVNEFITKENESLCRSYIEETKNKSDLDRTGTNKDKTGVFTGSYVINPFNNEKVPLWIADYVLGNYGTGAVMAVPAHDERDFEFAKKYGIEIRQSVQEGMVCEAWNAEKCMTLDGILVNSGEFSNLTSKEARQKMTEFAEKNGFGFKKVNYKLRDWLFSRQRYWGEPIPLIHIEEKDLSVIPEFGFGNNDIISAILNGTKLIETRVFKDNYSEIKSGDIVIFHDYVNNTKYLIKVGNIHNWVNLEELFNDKESLSKIFADDSKYISLDELKKTYEEIDSGYVKKIETNGLIGFSFEIISKIYDGLYTKIIVDKNLPLELPEVDKYAPSETGESPLANVPDFVNIQLGNNLKGKRETNTMPQWGGSCWYYLRFMDPDNNEMLVGKDAENYWQSVDSYVGGAEHAVLHLLYARFWHKFLYDIGVVTTIEPFARLRNQGLILAYAFQTHNGGLIANDLVEEKGDKYYNIETGEEVNKIVAKMSKSLKNVVNPDDIVDEYGADALRLYEMYMSDFKDSAPWDTRNIIGVKRFLDKVWNLYENGKYGENDDESIKLLNKTIKKVGEDIENYKFNTAIAQLMILINYGHPKEDGKLKIWKETFLKLLHPFAPHISEELWQYIGYNESIFFSEWPEYDEKLIIDDELEIAVQVLGKLRGTIKINKDEDKDSVMNKAKNNDEVKKWLEGKEIIKEIYVPGKIVNLVIK